MGRPIQYTFRRRILLQAVMVAILGCTLALAQAIRHSRINNPSVRMDQMIGFGTLLIPIPDGWTSRGVQISPGDEDVHILVIREPVDARRNGSPRTLEVLQKQSIPGESPSQFLWDEIRAPETRLERIKIAETDGVFARVPGSADEGPDLSHLYAATVLPDGVSVLLHLKVEGRPLTDGDKQLLYNVAGLLRHPTADD